MSGRPSFTQNGMLSSDRLRGGLINDNAFLNTGQLFQEDNLFN